MANRTSRILQFFGINPNPTETGLISNQPPKPHDINTRIIRMKLDRIKQDVALWRQAISEAESVYYPNRLSLQRLFVDTVLNGHVLACMRERKDLTLLKDFAFVNSKGVENEQITEMFKSAWFYELIEYILDAQFYGYSYVNWTGINKSKLTGIQLIKRWNISPDRLEVLPFPNSFAGFSLFEEDNLDWSLYVPTISLDGISPCGWGLLRSVAYYEIFLRNLTGFNGDFVQTFAQPFRQAKTNKTEGPERDKLEQSMQEMGSSAWIVTDTIDEILFHNETGGGNGYKSYESFQERIEKTISKLFFGHADAIDSTKGKLGSGQGQEHAPVNLAIKRTEAADGRFVETVINDSLIEKLNNLGFNIPSDLKFKLLNNKEEAAEKEAITTQNQAVATVVKTMYDAGFETTPEWITLQTGMPMIKKPIPEPIKPAFGKDIKNMLDETYGNI